MHTTDFFGVFKQYNLREQTSFLRTLLMAGKVSVEFTKVDGTQRYMVCTLAEDLLPPVDPAVLAEQATKPPRKENPTVLRVFDLDINEWRSFRIDSVTNITLL